MFMPIPLTPTLRIEVQLIIKYTRSTHHLPLPILPRLLRLLLPNDLILKHPPPKTRKLDILQAPIQLYMLARLDLRARLLHDHGREQVECAEFVFDGAIVPVTPHAALRLAGDVRKVIKGGKDMRGARGTCYCGGGLCGGGSEG